MKTHLKLKLIEYSFNVYFELYGLNIVFGNVKNIIFFCNIHSNR